MTTARPASSAPTDFDPITLEILWSRLIRLVAFSGTTAHSPDIGGSLWGADCRELYEEGLRIPPIRFMAGGEPNRDVFDFILANVRVSEQVMGDLYSQVSANQVCARRLAE